jgi:hypothetical protein
VHVEVVGRRRAAAERELDEAGVRRDVRRLLVQARPQRVERPQPVEEVAAQRGRERAREVLVQVVVGVDEPRRHQAAGRVEHPLRRRRRVAGAAHAADQPAGHGHPAAGELPPVVVHGRDEQRVADEQVGGRGRRRRCRHRSSSPSV